MLMGNLPQSHRRKYEDPRRSSHNLSPAIRKVVAMSSKRLSRRDGTWKQSNSAGHPVAVAQQPKWPKQAFQTGYLLQDIKQWVALAGAEDGKAWAASISSPFALNRPFPDDLG